MQIDPAFITDFHDHEIFPQHLQFIPQPDSFIMFPHNITELMRQAFQKFCRLLIFLIQCGHSDHIQRIVQIMRLNLHLQSIQFCIFLTDLCHVYLIDVILQFLHHFIKSISNDLHLVMGDIQMHIHLTALYFFHRFPYFSDRCTHSIGKHNI